MRLILFLLLFTPFLSHATINPVRPSPFQGHLGYSGTYFHTKENFSAAGGGFNALANGGGYQEFNSVISADWDLNDQWRLKSNFEFSMVKSETAVYSRENSHMDKIGLGVEHWRTLGGQIPMIIYSQALIPVFKPDLNSIDAYGSDGAFNFDLGAFVRPRFANFIGHFGLGYKWRSENLSHLLPWTAGLAYGFGVGHVGGGIRGFQTVVKDSASLTDKNSRGTSIQNAQGGSLIYNSVDPQLQQLYVESRWGIFNGLDLSTDLGYDINGAGYAKGIHVGLAVHWLVDFSGLSGKSSTSSPNFNTDDGKYRRDLFEKSDPTQAPRPPKRTTPQKSIKQLLDETEQLLED